MNQDEFDSDKMNASQDQSFSEFIKKYSINSNDGPNDNSYVDNNSKIDAKAYKKGFLPSIRPYIATAAHHIMNFRQWKTRSKEK